MATGSGRGTCDPDELQERRRFAKTRITMATDKAYTELVASKEGLSNVPPGTRTRLYENPNYLEAAAFADETKAAMDAADIHQANELDPRPTRRASSSRSPSSSRSAPPSAQLFLAVLAGQSSVDDALA